MKNRKSNRKVDDRLAKACFKEARRCKRKARKERVKKLEHLHD